MAAGLGFKDFTTGEVLTAADVDGYLMQGIWVFANATARDAAVTSPQEGNSCYLKDTDVIQVYSGSSWVVKSGGSSPLTTKGDLYTYSTTDTRIGVGANNTVLTADSTTATGLKWAAPAGGGANWTLLNTGGTTLTSFSTTISGISGQDKIMVLWSGTATQADFRLRLNADSGSNYNFFGSFMQGDSSFQAGLVGNISSTAQTSIFLAKTSNSGSASTTSGGITITGCNSSGLKQFISTGGADFNSAVNQRNLSLQGFYSGSSTISSITILCSSGSFGGGTVWVYASA